MQYRLGLRLLIVAVGLVVIATAIAVAADYRVRWRAMVIRDKAIGRLTDVGWSDLAWMLRPGSGIYLERLADTHNPFEVIESPRQSDSDLDAGARLFRQHCSSCHGDGGVGGVGGPSLLDRTFRQGRSDWALYRTITRGVPGTAMIGRRLPRDDVWRLVSYINRTIATRNAQKRSAMLSFAHAPYQPVAPAELRDADNHPSEWLTYSGSYSGHRYSRLRQITRDNVGQLRVEWERQFLTADIPVETSPIVRSRTMFVTEPPNRVLALDARSGRVLWTYSRDLPSRLLLCCGSVNRGVAVLGDRVFVGTLDAHLVALNASTGAVEWDIAVAEPSTGYSITGAPLAVEDMVVTGVAGGEFGKRGFIDAYDAASGKRRWRFYTVPAPGEAGSETWGGDPLQHRGAPTWLTGSYDPELRLVYWGVGNPSPEFYGEKRRGDNLYSDSVVALDAESGKLRWHFQFTPHDLHDWDSVQIPLLIDVQINNSPRKLLAWANRNAFYYLLDRVTGEFLLGTPFAKQNWADGLDAGGRPRVRPESIPTRRGTVVYPGVGGATNWWSPSYDPELHLVFVPTVDRGNVFYASPGQIADLDGQILGGGYSSISDEDAIASVEALDATTGHVRWQYTRPPRKFAPQMGGLMSTAGELVFGGDLDTIFALDARTGAELWRFEAGGRVLAAPISYELDGRQFITVVAGRSVLTFALPELELAKHVLTTVH